MSLDGEWSPSTTSPSRSHTIIESGVSSSYDTPLGLITSRSCPGTRAETLPAVQATSPYRVSSACRSQTVRRISGDAVPLLPPHHGAASARISFSRCITSLPPLPK